MNIKELSEKERNRRIELAKAHLQEIVNSRTFRVEIEATEKEGTFEAYRKLDEKLARELFSHLERYKGNSGATAYSIELTNILNGVETPEQK